MPALGLALVLPVVFAVASEQQGDTATAATSDTNSGDDSNGAGPTVAEAKQRLRQSLQAQRPGIEISSIRATPVPDIFEVVSGGQIYYITGDAGFLFSGNLVDLRADRNLTEDRRSEMAHEVVQSLDRAEMVVFEPAQKPAKHHITVFTDTTCPYCQRLHRELLSMVENHPVEVRYAMFPRAGPDSAAAETLRNIWCAEDSAQAMTRAKQGESVADREQGCKTPLAEHMQAAGKIGVRGTPYLVLGDDGPVVPGYRPKDKLLSMLGIGDDQSASAGQ